VSKMRLAKAIVGCSGAAMALGQAAPACAHAFGQRYDLPVPLGLYLAGAGAAVAFSFVVIGIFFRDIAWTRAYPRLNLLRYPLGRLAAHPLVLFVLKLAAVLLFALVVAAGSLGNQQPLRNIAPTMVWVLWWVGLAVVSAFVGDLWALINPWRTLFAWAEALYRRLSGGRALSLGLPWPAALGVWPAVALLLAFAWLELVFPAPALCPNIAWMALAYSVITWTGMLLFGHERWLRHGEVFALFFGLLARFAPLEIRVFEPRLCDACGLGCRDLDRECINCATCFESAGAADREWALRPYAVGLLRNEPGSTSMVAFVLLVMAAVLFDGLLATPAWRAFEDWLLAPFAPAGDLSSMVARTLGLVGVWLVFLGAYAAICRIMAAATDGRLATGTIARRFVLTLIPIAIAYHLAHYLSFLLIQGQYAIPLASDPFGRGWDLFGTAGYRVDIAVVGARFAWYLAVIAIVVGHIVAVFLAHVQAMVILPERRPALRSQIPMTALMVAFTVISLSILAEPIVERAPAAAETTAPRPAAVAVPADAVLPAAATGRLQPVGPGQTAKVVLSYGAMTSLFHDGTRTGLADILYPFAFAYRWGAEGEGAQDRHDRGIGRATALLRERLVGLRPTGVDAASKSFRVGELEFAREMQLVEVYLNAAPADPVEAAAVAPPWSDVPWHVIALMEEAVARGFAAFSEQEARRRGVPWLDLARDAPLKERLAGLVDAFARDGFVPAALESMVTTEQARARWQALAAFYAEHDHFLVTNGPYALTSWSPEVTVLEVFRDVSYPLGVGSFDAYAIPRRAYVAEIEVQDGGIRVAAEIEKVEKVPRSYRIVREPVGGGSALAGDTLECRYLVVAADGTVRRTGLGRLEEDGAFRIDLDQEDLPPGAYTVLVTLTLNGNTLDPDIRAVPYVVPG
jgi:hypothetical protein